MEPLKLIEPQPGQFSLLLNDYSTSAIDATVTELGHTPNGYFWEGVAQTIVRQQAPELKSRFRFDCEAGMFCAYGTDRAALDQLGRLMSVLATSPDALRALMSSANPDDFDD